MGNQVKWYGDKLLAEIRDAAPEALFAAGEMLIKEAAARAPKASGELRDSGYVSIEGKSTYSKRKGHLKAVKPPKGGAVAGFAHYRARFIEFGTKPHMIGKPGKVLRLKNGQFVRGPISHPGTPARPFFRPALDELKNELGAIIVEKVRRKLK